MLASCVWCAQCTLCIRFSIKTHHKLDITIYVNQIAAIICCATAKKRTAKKRNKRNRSIYSVKLKSNLYANNAQSIGRNDRKPFRTTNMDTIHHVLIGSVHRKCILLYLFMCDIDQINNFSSSIFRQFANNNTFAHLICAQNGLLKTKRKRKEKKRELIWVFILFAKGSSSPPPLLLPLNKWMIWFMIIMYSIALRFVHSNERKKNGLRQTLMQRATNKKSDARKHR